VINAAHVVIFTKDAETDRAFFRDVLGFPAVDAGGGWLIFCLPPAELACILRTKRLRRAARC
jgi:catechol 2,3-dioxygenase-like lactoylglutathione lyase family enzyme